jgi:replicative DNA helicase
MSTPPNINLDPGAPFSQEAEEAVIGSILIDPGAYITVAAFLKPDDFFLLRHKTIWQALERLNSRAEAIDHITLAEELENMQTLDEIGGRAYLIQLANNTGTSMYAEVYGRLVERTSIRRKLMIAADDIKKLAMDEALNIDTVVSDAESKLFTVTETQIKRDFVPMWDALSDYYDRMEYMLQNRSEAVGVPSGFRDLDALLGGFQKSDLLVFAGRPGMGKCLGTGANIITSFGTVAIESLKPENIEGESDDEGGVYYPLEIGVLTPEGIKKTSHFYDAGEKPTLKMTTHAGKSLSGTHNHPVMILNGGEKTWQRLSEVQVGDYVAIQVPRPLGEGFRVRAKTGAIHHVPTQKSTVGTMPALSAATLSLLSADDVLPDGFIWDEIVSIEDDGLQHCYDLVVPEVHSYIANGIVSHNTSWLLTTAMNTARLGARVAIFTMEMGVEQMVQRMVAMETGINVQKLRLAQLTPQEAARFTEAVGRISNFPIFIDDSPAISPMEMRTKARRLKHEHGLDMIMVDYMQLMNAGGTYENNRVQEISYISRALKELAREMNVPLISAAQLSRAVEQRQDKRPVLSDLRESGCLTGDSLVYLPDCGYSMPIADLMGKAGFRVMSLNTDTWKTEIATVTNSFCTGIKPVFRMTTALGRTIRATANHKFLTIEGWKRLDELRSEEHIAVLRCLPNQSKQTMSDSELALLGHLIGDGCTLPSHALQYTTVENDLAELVSNLATDIFGDKVAPRIHKEPRKSWYQVFLPPTKHLTHGVRNPVGMWIENLGQWGLRSHEKYIPDKVFEQSNEAIALFLRHLWATDGCIRKKKTKRGYYPAVYYATSSSELAYGVQTLLLRFEINARVRIVPQIGKGRDQYHVIITGIPDLDRFVQIGAVGEYKQKDMKWVAEYVATHNSNTNRDVIPRNVWRGLVVPAMQEIGLSTRKMQAALPLAYCGTGLYKSNLSRGRAARVSEVVHSEQLENLANSDIYWDKIISIQLDGEEAVYDLTVESNHNFVCDNIIVHNSIEQDSDIVMFLYRDEVYNDATEFPNQADIIIAKHRNGPTGVVSLYFEKSLTKFMDASVHRVDLSDLE